MKPEWLLSELGRTELVKYQGGQSSSWHLSNTSAGCNSLLLNRKYQNVDLETYRGITVKSRHL